MDTIVHVDDDPAVRELFALYLTLGGYRPLSVPGGAACLELLKRETPDLLVLDLMMEPMDGWETLVAIIERQAPRQIPVVIISGKQPVPKEILKFGGYLWAYLIKPVDIERAVASFHAIISRDRELLKQAELALRRGADPKLISEYACTLRLVTVAHTLDQRRKRYAWTESVPIKNHEDRLHVLHTLLGFPDSLLEQGDLQ